MPRVLAKRTGHLDRFGYATAEQVARAARCSRRRAAGVLTRLRLQGLAQSCLLRSDRPLVSVKVGHPFRSGRPPRPFPPLMPPLPSVPMAPA